jgi:undecaprenyl-diphosphatase
MAVNDGSKRSNPTGWLAPLAHRLRRLVLGCLNFVGQHEFKVLLVLFVLLLAILAFVGIAEYVSAGATQRIDERTLMALRQPSDARLPIGPRWLGEVGRDLTALGGVAVLSLLTLAICGYLWLRGMYRAMILILSATLGALVVSTLLKMSFDRPRPSAVPHLASVYTSSFPSGHSMLSATVFLTLGTLMGQFAKQRRLKAYFLLIALVLTLLVGVSRVYLGVHYPTDVLAGWAAGLAWASLCWLIARYLQQRGAIDEERLS